MKRLLIAFLVSGGMLALGGEISDYYYKHAGSSKGDMRDTLRKSRPFGEITSTDHGITEIGIERTPCYGTCPAYTFIAKNDDSFRYKGEKFAERAGEFTGTISDWDFNQLAKFIKDSGYMQLEDEYTAQVTDNPTVYTFVVLNGQRKTIRNYANAGPTKLWAIEQLVDGLMATAK